MILVEELAEQANIDEDELRLTELWVGFFLRINLICIIVAIILN